MAEKKKTLVIKSKSAMPLKVFEGADATPNNKKYIFQGVFTACSTPDHTVVNRNGRVYTAQECLRHLAYLRENIRRDGFILGELDHPVDRFDTQLKEASHKITDLWYDQNTACIMGKIEVLDTPNGKIARQLIDSGYPVFVSSRAAGEVDTKTKEVHIEQIFTYDIVCTPGFAEARLERVNESYRPKVMSYLNESASYQKSNAAATKTMGILLEGVSVCAEYKGDIVISESAKQLMEKDIDMNALSKPLCEEENFQLPMNDLSINGVKEEDTPEDKPEEEEKKSDDAEEKKDDEKKDDEKEPLTDEEKAANRAKILKVVSIDSEGNSSDSADKEEKRAQILDVEGIEDEEKSDEDEKSDEETKSEEEEVFDENTEEKTDECGGADTQEGNDDKELIADDKDSDDPRDVKTKDAGKNTDAAKKALNDCDKAEDIKKQTEQDMDKFKSLLAKAKKVADVKESIIKAYPFAVSLSDENFSKFAALSPAQKNKVFKFITEHAMFDVASINSNWATPLLEERRLMKNWMRLATEEDRKLFAEQPKEVQDMIEESAKYVMIRTQADADRFWENTGLRRMNADRILRQSLNEKYNVLDESRKTDASDEAAKALGYSQNYMKMLEDYFTNN